jgi:hypothetical protein
MSTNETESEDRKVEIISCLCGEIIAACVDGGQDDDWIESREFYKRKGYSVEITVNQSFRFGQCRCSEIVNFVKESHPEIYYKPGTQLKMF